jgi:class 3 adenylate cyclase
MKVLPRAKNSILLVLTDQNNQSEIKMMTQAGAKGVILKPFTKDNLLVNVERTIANQRAELEKAHIEKYISKASRKIAIEKSILSGSGNFNRADHKNATLFFSDIKDFTNRCERYTPSEIVEQINTLFSVMTRVIHKSGGDIDKFIGDACMAFWTDEDPNKTSLSALNFMVNIREELKKLNEESLILRSDPIQLRMGLNTGKVILCDIGAAEARIDLTMIGDTVNLAARLESAAKQYGLDNLISEYSIKPHKGLFAARSIDQIKVKGKEKPVEVFEFVGSVGLIDPKQVNLIKAYENAIQEYRLGNFNEALELFKDSVQLEAHPEKLNPSSLMIKRCNELIKTPPEGNWEGVWTLSDK